MSRSGYSDDYEDCDSTYPPQFYWEAVRRAITGKRGQKFLRELAKEMDAMPEKRLIVEELIDDKGQCCTMGVVCKARGIDVTDVNECDSDHVSGLLGIASALAKEIAYENDERGPNDETPEELWVRMRQWVDEKIKLGCQ